MARSLIKQIDSLWVFLEVYGVDPTNDHAERMYVMVSYEEREVKVLKAKKETFG